MSCEAVVARVAPHPSSEGASAKGSCVFSHVFWMDMIFVRVIPVFARIILVYGDRRLGKRPRMRVMVRAANGSFSSSFGVEGLGFGQKE